MSLPYQIAVYTLAACVFMPVDANAQAARAPRVATAATQLSAADQAFIRAHEAARVGDATALAAVAPGLGKHLLASYVEFWQLVLRVQADEPGIEAAVGAFLDKHPDTYLADRLRLEWALTLGARGDYAALEREAAQLVWASDDNQLRCYRALGRYRTAGTDEIGEAALQARQLLINTRDSAGVGCLALTEALLADERLSVWDRIRALVEQNQFTTAKRIGRRAVDSDGRPLDPKLLAQAIDRPAAWLTSHARRLTSVQRELALVAIARLARDNPQGAAEHANALHLLLTPEQRGIVWGRIGHMAALRLMPEANEWYRRGGDQVGLGPDAVRSSEVLAWQARAALRAGDWAAVRAVIDRMPTPLADDPTWIYWRARALQQQGREFEAQAEYMRIAQQFHFYGKLAAEELGQPIVLPPRAAAPTAAEVAAFASNAGFARALKFYELGLRLEGHREWNWQLRRLDDRQLLAAAEYARRQGVLDRMINTSERTKGEYDFTQRFPTPFRDTMARYAVPLGLDENWIYGLIRQESRFIMDARSSVGASGLMQLMPATARYVARKLAVPNFSPQQVNDLDINIQLGTGYLKMVLDDLDGSPLLATAAYNAGPGRPRAWRSSLARPVEGAIFAETIPFNETRDYVKRVMSNAVYYATLADNRAHSLKARLGSVAPKAAGTTELP